MQEIGFLILSFGIYIALTPNAEISSRSGKLRFKYIATNFPVSSA